MWWAATPGGDRPVLVLTRDPIADRIGGVVVAACTRTIRGLHSELRLGPRHGMPEECVANFDNVHTVRRPDLRARITRLDTDTMTKACSVLNHSLGCV